MTERNARGGTPPHNRRLTDDDAQRLQDYALLISGLLHELRTPLGSIVGGASVLDQYSGKLDEARKSRICTGIMDQAHKLDSLFTALAGLARARTGTLLRQEQVCELNELLRGFWAATQSSGRSAGKIKLQREEVFLKSDPAALSLLVSTMLALAVLLGPDECKSSLSLTVEGVTAVVSLQSITRDGMTISLANLPGAGQPLPALPVEGKADAICLAAIWEVVHSLGGEFDIQHNDSDRCLCQTARFSTVNVS